MLPLIIMQTSPYALLIGVLYSFGELNRNNEVLTIRASGISLVKLALPVFFLAFTVSAAALFAQETLLAGSQKGAEELKMKFIKRDISHSRDENKLAFHSGDTIFFVERFSPKDKTLYESIIFNENDKKNISRRMMCKKIVYRGKKWVGEDIYEYKLDSDGNMLGVPSQYKEKIIELDEKPDELIFKKSIYAQFSSLRNLKKEMRRLKKMKATNLFSDMLVDFNYKISQPFAHLFLIIGAIPLALEIKKRKASLSSLGVGFLCGFLYYFVNTVSVNLAKTGVILPILGAWTAPLFFTGAGITALLLIK